jgi:hypothetical protein
LRSLDAAAGDFRLTDEGRAFLDDEAGGLQVALQRAARLQLAALADGDVALHFAENVIDLVLISPRMSAFSPIVKTPSEWIRPSTCRR